MCLGVYQGTLFTRSVFVRVPRVPGRCEKGLGRDNVCDHGVLLIFTINFRDGGFIFSGRWVVFLLMNFRDGGPFCYQFCNEFRGGGLFVNEISGRWPLC